MADFRTELADSPGTRHALHSPSSDQVAAEAPISCPYCHTSTEAVWMAFYNPLGVMTNLVWQLDRPGWNRLIRPAHSGIVVNAADDAWNPRQGRRCPACGTIVLTPMEMGGIGATARRGPSRTEIIAFVALFALTAFLIGSLFAFSVHV